MQELRTPQQLRASAPTSVFKSPLNEFGSRSARQATEVCDENAEDYKLFNISLGDITILEPKEDLCSAKESWWSDNACPRAVVNTMAPLLVSKMITRALLQPIITLLRWA